MQAVLAARIDALPAADKHLLQEAAVIGHDVPFALLHAICGLTEDELRSLLDNLQAAEFLYSTQLFPDLQYTFKHALTHDVAYSGVLHERRREIHARVVDATEKLYADRLGEQVERLAYHAVQGDTAGEGSALSPAGRSEGGRAIGARGRRAWFEQALDVLKSLPESQATMEQAFEIRLELRPVLRQLGEGRQMLEHLREAEALAERLKDDRRRGQVCAFMTTVLSSLDELDEALVTGKRALEIAQRLGDLRLRIVTTAISSRRITIAASTSTWSKSPPTNLAALPADWVQEYVRYGRAGIGLRSRLADHEPRRARQIRRGGQIRGGGDPTRRANTACAHHRLGLLRREHASPSQGRLGEGALTESSSGSQLLQVWKCRRPTSLGGRLLRLGAGAARRGQARR